MPEQPKDLPTEQQRNGSDRQSAVSTTTSYLTQSVAIVGVIAITVVITLWLSRDSERSGVEILIPPPAPSPSKHQAQLFGQVCIASMTRHESTMR